MIRVVAGWSLIAATVAAGIAKANAPQTETRCHPVIVPPCENALKMHFERGAVPNRCNVS